MLSLGPGGRTSLIAVISRPRDRVVGPACKMPAASDGQRTAAEASSPSLCSLSLTLPSPSLSLSLCYCCCRRRRRRFCFCVLLAAAACLLAGCCWRGRGRLPPWCTWMRLATVPGSEPPFRCCWTCRDWAASAQVWQELRKAAAAAAAAASGGGGGGGDSNRRRRRQRPGCKQQRAPRSGELDAPRGAGEQAALYHRELERRADY